MKSIVTHSLSCCWCYMLTLQALACFEGYDDRNGETIWSCATSHWHSLRRAKPKCKLYCVCYTTQLWGSAYLCKLQSNQYMVSYLPELWGNTLILQKNLEESWIFLILSGVESLFGWTCQNRLWRGGDSTLKNWIVYLFFLFAQSRKII